MLYKLLEPKESKNINGNFKLANSLLFYLQKATISASITLQTLSLTTARGLVIALIENIQ